MSKARRYIPEQIITKLREAELLQSEGMSIEEAARKLEITSQTYYRWRKEYGNMNTISSAIMNGELQGGGTRSSGRNVLSRG